MARASEFRNSAVGASLIPNQFSLSPQQPNQSFAVNVNLPLQPSQGWYFGEIIWQNQLGQTIRQALAIEANNTNSDLLSVTVSNGEDFSKLINLTSTNSSVHSQLNYELSLVGAAQFQPDSLSNNSAAKLVHIMSQPQKLQFSSELATGNISATSGELPFNIDVSEQESYQRVPCYGKSLFVTII